MLPSSGNRIRALVVISALLVFQCLSPPGVPALENSFRNSLGMEFVLIPPGTFMMGSPSSESYRDGDETRHPVTITRPFYLQTTEVTVGQWRALMGWKLFGRHRGEGRPVVKVSWHDCMDFVEKLNKLGQGRYRLPTEAEWEYACRARSESAYSWGNGIDCTKAMYGNNSLKSDECIPYVKKQGFPVDGPAPVKSYPPNPWGLYDMHGNVWEWCSDWYGPYPNHAVSDPQGPGSGEVKVRRGGSWFRFGFYCRSANRNYGRPDNRYRTLGFRVVRIAEAPR